MEGWKGGKVVGWKDGRVERDGRVEEGVGMVGWQEWIGVAGYTIEWIWEGKDPLDVEILFGILNFCTRIMGGGGGEGG